MGVGCSTGLDYEYERLCADAKRVRPLLISVFITRALLDCTFDVTYSFQQG